MIKDVLRFLWRRDAESACDLIMLLAEDLPDIWVRDIGDFMIRHSRNPEGYVDIENRWCRLYRIARVLWWHSLYQRQDAIFSLMDFLSPREHRLVGARLQTMLGDDR